MAVSSLVQWYGGNRMHARKVGELIGKQDLIGVPFGGGLGELPYLDARQILVNDKHELLYNLYHCASSNGAALHAILNERIYHPAELANAQEWMRHSPPLQRAANYFTVNWMTRCSGGMRDESDGSLAMRWTASGGSSIARWKAAVEGLPKWSELLRTKCECTCLDWRDFAKKWQDRKGHALYLDPPWIDAGDDYLHSFTSRDHLDMAEWAKGLKHTLIVIRHSEHENYRWMYEGWEWFPVDEAKNQAGNKTGEVLIRRIGRE